MQDTFFTQPDDLVYLFIYLFIQEVEDYTLISLHQNFYAKFQKSIFDLADVKKNFFNLKKFFFFFFTFPHLDKEKILFFSVYLLINLFIVNWIDLHKNYMPSFF